MAKPTETLDQIEARLDSGKTFDGNNISYSVSGRKAPIDGDGKRVAASDETALTAAQQADAKEAFELWDDLVPQHLNNIESNHADISMNYSDSVAEGVGGSTFRHTTDATIDSADIVFPNRDSHADANFAGFGSHAQKSYIHEAGHALGLKHPGDYQARDGDHTYADHAQYAQDSQQYSVMSYFKSDEAGVDHTNAAGKYVSPQTPMLHDVAAIQEKYGADMTTRSGDTTYGFNSNAGRDVFDFTQNKTPVLTVWDGGGKDTLDMSGFNGNQTINLAEGSFSSVGNKHGAQATELTSNVAVAHGAKIENAIGGSGNDRLEGNALANELTGGAGNDVLDGKAGADVMKGGTGDDLYVVDNAKDKVIDIKGDAGHDTIRTSISSYDLSAAGKGAGVEDLEYWGKGNFKGTGNELDNKIQGGAGNDVLDGGKGADLMRGGSGNDVYIVDNAGDRVIDVSLPGFKGDGGHDTIRTTLNAYSLGAPDKGADVEDLKFEGKGDFKGTGNALDNKITGGAGNDSINGGGGHDSLLGGGGRDHLSGGSGNDTLTGGAGADTFSFSGSWGADKITDFKHGTDSIHLQHANLTSFDQLSVKNTKGGVLVSYEDSSILIAGESAQSLSASDFKFSPLIDI